MGADFSINAVTRKLLSSQSQAAIADFRRVLQMDPKLESVFANDTLTPSQFAFGIYCLFQKRSENPQPVLLPSQKACRRINVDDHSSKYAQDNRKLFSSAAVYARLSEIAYLETDAKIGKALKHPSLAHYDFKILSTQTDHGTAAEALCAHYLVVSRKCKLAVLAIRGTASYRDVITDLLMKPDKLSIEGLKEYGKCHGGIAVAVTKLYQRLWVASEILMDAGYKLRLVGHSLGGGSAALLATALKANDLATDVRAVCFAPPAVASRRIALESRDFVDTFVHGHDGVSRLSPRAGLHLISQMIALNWDDIVEKCTGKAVIGDLAITQRKQLIELRKRYGLTDDTTWPELADKWMKEKMEKILETDAEVLDIQLPGRVFLIYDDPQVVTKPKPEPVEPSAKSRLIPAPFRSKSEPTHEVETKMRAQCYLLEAETQLEIEVSQRAGTDHSINNYMELLENLAERSSDSSLTEPKDSDISFY
eukprot:Partr_v1_DN27486_c0_g1_i2_m71547 putative diacylglycerol lipase